MNLIKINLLPYRELREMKQKKQFQNILAGGFLLGALACGGVYMVLDKAIEHQNSRNQSLQEGIESLKKEITTIQTLRADKERFLERKKKVEELDNKRFDGARIVDSLNQVVPDGAYLVQLKGSDSDNSGGNGSTSGREEYTIEGRALSDNKVALLMAALPSTGMFDLPDLVEIAKAGDSQRFVLKSTLADPSLLPPPSVAPKTPIVPAGNESEEAAPAPVPTAEQSASAPPPAADAPPPPPASPAQ